MSNQTKTNSNKLQNDFNSLMCDKITHLTKIVFLLNSQKDEGQAMIESIIDSYENELELIVKEANDAMSILKKKIKEKKTDNEVIINSKVKVIEGKYNDTCELYRVKYEQLKTEVNHRELFTHKDTMHQIEQMKNELGMIRRDAEIRIQEYLTTKDEERKLKVKEIEKMNNDRALMKKTYEKKIEELDIELKNQIEKSKNELLKRTNEKDAIIKGKDKKLKEQLEEIDALKKKITANDKIALELNTQLNNMKKDYKVLKDNEKEMKEKLKHNEELFNENKIKYDKTINKLTEWIDKDKKEKEMIVLKEKDKLFNENEAMKVTIEDLNKKIALIESQSTIEEKAKITKELNEKQDKITQLHNDISFLNNKITFLTQEIADANQKNSNNKESEIHLRNQLDKLKVEYDNQEKNIKIHQEAQNIILQKKQKEDKINYDSWKAAETQKNQASIQSLNVSINNMSMKIKDYEHLFKKNDEDFTSKAKEMKENYTKEINNLKLKYQSQMEEEKKKMIINTTNNLSQAQQHIKALELKLHEEKKAIESKHREELDRLNFHNILKVNEVQLKLESKISNLKIEIIQLKEKLDEHYKTGAIIVNPSYHQSQKSTVTPIKGSFTEINAQSTNLKENACNVNSKEGFNEPSDNLKKDLMETINYLEEKNIFLSNELIKLNQILLKHPMNNNIEENKTFPADSCKENNSGSKDIHSNQQLKPMKNYTLNQRSIKIKNASNKIKIEAINSKSNK